MALHRAINCHWFVPGGHALCGVPCVGGDDDITSRNATEGVPYILRVCLLSVIRQKLAAIEQGPVQVFIGLLLRRAAAGLLDQSPERRLGRKLAKRF